MKYLILAFLFFYISYSSAQQRSFIITGTVVDSLSGSPLKDFSLSYLIGNHLQYISYKTDKNGLFTSEVIRFQFDKVKVSNLGFESRYFPIRATNVNDSIKLYKVYMIRKVIELDEILVRKKNNNLELDTLKYNFNDSIFNRSILAKDVLKLIPKFKIVDGQIYYNDQKVSKLNVNGQKFFFDDQQFTLNNLPGFSIDRIEIIKVNDKKKGYLINPLSVNIILKKESNHGLLSNSLISHTLNKRISDNLLLGALIGNTQLSLNFNDNNISNKSPNLIDNNLTYGNNRERNVSLLYTRKLGKYFFDIDFQNHHEKNVLEQSTSRIDYLSNNALISNYLNSNSINSTSNRLTGVIKYLGGASNLEFSQNISSKELDMMNDINQNDKNDVLKFIQRNRNLTNNTNSILKYTYRDTKHQNLILNATVSQNSEKTLNNQFQKQEIDKEMEFLNTQLKFKSELTYLFNQRFFLLFDLAQSIDYLKYRELNNKFISVNSERKYMQQYNSTGLKLYKIWNKLQFDIKLSLLNFRQNGESEEIRNSNLSTKVSVNYNPSNKLKIGINYTDDIHPITLSQISSTLYNTNEIVRTQNFIIKPEKNNTIELTLEKTGINRIIGNFGYLDRTDVADDILTNFNNPEIVFSNAGNQNNFYFTIRQETALLKKFFFSNYFNFNIGRRLGENTNIINFKNVLKEFSTTITYSDKEWNFSLTGNLSKTKRSYNLLPFNEFYNSSFLIKSSHLLWHQAKIDIISNFLYNKSIGSLPSMQKVWLNNLIIEQTLLKNKNISCFSRIQDIFNKSKNFRQQIVVGNSLQNSSTSGLGRYFLFGLTYRFNTLKNN